MRSHPESIIPNPYPAMQKSFGSDQIWIHDTAVIIPRARHGCKEISIFFILLFLPTLVLNAGNVEFGEGKRGREPIL
jgi:hypothetical protein